MTGSPFQAPPAGGGTPLSKLKAVSKQMIERFTPTNRTQDIMSYDYRQTPDVVPAGTTATAHGLQVPDARMLARLEAWTVVAPGAGESTTIRMFRTRGIGGFSFALLNTPFVLDASSYLGPGIPIDLTSLILPNVELQPGDFFACSWVHVGPQVMSPLNVNWNTSCKAPAPSPPPVVVAGSWPPS